MTLGAATHVSTAPSALRTPLVSWLGNLPTIFSTDFMLFTEGQYRPLPYALVAVLRTWVSPESVFFWHLLLVGFQWLNALLVFLLAREILRRDGPALAAGAVFAVHPLGAVVANDPAQIHILTGSTFFLGSVLFYVRGTASGRRGPLAASLALYAAGLITCKLVASAPLFMVGFELLRRRGDARRSVLRPGLFLVPLAVVAPVWYAVLPHPNFYAYAHLPSGTAWVSVLTEVGISGKYWAALLVGSGIPARMRDIVHVIFSPASREFLIWMPPALVAAWLTVRAARRRSPAALGVLFAAAAFVPYANVVWNPVDDHVALAYLYLPVAGVALVIGALVEGALASGSSEKAKAATVVACFLVVFYGVRLAKINWDIRTPEGYWRRSLSVAPSSATARARLGRLLLAKRSETADRVALGLLFAPDAEDFDLFSPETCLAYAERSEPVAALVHARYLREVTTGLRARRRAWASARVALSAGALDHAEMFLGRVLHANPYDTGALALLARVWLAKGYARAAQRALEAALSIQPDCAEAREAGALVAARIAAARGGARAPELKLPPIEWAVYLLENKRGPGFRRAVIETADRLIADPILQVEAGLCLLEEGLYEESLEVLDQVLPRFSFEARPWNEVIQEIYSRASDERLLEAGLAVVERDGAQPLARRALANSLASRGRFDEAERHLRAAVRLIPGCRRARTELATVLIRRGALDEAVRMLSRLLEEDASDGVVMHNLATALLRRGRIGEAVVQYRRTLELDPDDAGIMEDLAGALMLAGGVPEAVELYRKAVAASPGDAGLHRSLAMALGRLGRPAEALDELKESLRLSPGDPVTLKQIGRLFYSGGRFVEAAEWLERSLNAAPTQIDAIDMLADALYKTGRVREAARWRRRAAELRSGKTPSIFDELE